jgi:peptidyl-prolyl cis-trans isomerase C
MTRSTAARKPVARPQPVSVNGIAISRAAIAQEIQNHPAASWTEARAEAARALVVRELLLQEARRLDLAAAPQQDAAGRRETDDEALIRALIEREIQPVQADDETCRRVFERNPDQFRTPALYEVRHILLAAPPDDDAARADAKAQATTIIDVARRLPATFAELARAHSACPSAATGGSLGQIGPGQTVPEFERALGRLPTGTVAPAPIETRYGVHVVWVERTLPGRALPFELVRERIAGWLNERARRTAIRRYIAGLMSRADIAGVDLPADAAPVVG